MSFVSLKDTLGSEQMNIDISAFIISSYEEVCELWQQCEGVGLSEADSRENIRMYLDRNPGMSFIAACRGKIIGAVLAGHDGRRGYIHHLAVATDFRRKGIARQLMNHTMVALAKSGIQKCHLFIFNSNSEGMAFWKAMGWTIRTDISVISKMIVTIPR